MVEEERTGNGALACLARGYRAAAAIIPEPSAERLGAAQTGTIWFQVTARGRPVHAAYATTGANAIDAAFHLIQGLRELETSWNAEKSAHPHFAGHDHPLNFNVGRIEGGEWPSSVPAHCVFDVRAAIFPGIIYDRGGEWPSSVPAHCVFDVRAAIFPGDDIRTCRAEIEACIRETAARNQFLRNDPPDVTYHGFFAEGYELDQSHPAIPALEDSHRQVTGETLDCLAFTATTDARFFGLYAGIPGLVYGPRAESIHGYDKRVEIESIRRNTQAIALFIAEWCGLVPG